MAPLSVRLNMRQKSLTPVNRTHKVHADYPVTIARRCQFKGAAHARTGVVAYDMHLAERSQGLRCSALYRCTIRYVTFDSPDTDLILFKLSHGIFKGINVNIC